VSLGSSYSETNNGFFYLITHELNSRIDSPHGSHSQASVNQGVAIFADGKELERLETVWIQAYKWAWGLPRTVALDVFILPAGMEYLRRNGAGAVPSPPDVSQT
jgi:hypothetical protein